MASRTWLRGAVTAAIAVASLASTANAQIEWRLEDGGNGHNYYAFSGTDWHSARQFAEDFGGYLLCVESEAEWDWVLSVWEDFDLDAPRVWLGFSDELLEGEWFWESGEAMTFTAWCDGEPNNANGGEHFAAMHFAHMCFDGSWFDYGSISHPFIVEVEPGECYADLTGDGVVDTQDFLLFLGAWAIGDDQADWDENGTIDTLDFLAYLNDWVAGC